MQLPMMPDVVRTANKDYKMGIQKIASVNTVCEIFSQNNVFRSDKLLQIYLTTSATAGRTFSTLRRLKSCMRLTMTQKRCDLMESVLQAVRQLIDFYLGLINSA